ncbi:MAG: DUF4112 domain-containing protein [Pyrinomonadaceae bacterium]
MRDDLSVNSVISVAIKMDDIQERRRVKVEEGLENLSRYLDGLFRIPGTTWRFGLDSLIGLVPNVGDTLTSFASFYILLAGVRYGVPKITLLRMAFNIGLDYVVGTIPFIGDAFDFFWKSNKQNMDLIRERATGKDVGTKGDYLFVFGIIGVLILLLLGSILVSAYVIWAIIWEIVSGNI